MVAYVLGELKRRHGDDGATLIDLIIKLQEDWSVEQKLRAIEGALRAYVTGIADPTR